MPFLKEFNENIYQPWHIEYVAYESIYNALYNICNNGQWTSKDENDFEDAIRVEAGKVDLFLGRKQREIESRIAYCKRTLSLKKWSQQDSNTIDDSLTDILTDINELNRFTRINFKALESLINIHDSLTNTNRQSLLVQICRTKPLDNQRFDYLLVQISSLMDICRNRLEPTTLQDTKNSNNNQLYNTRYWIHPENITEVKAILLFNLPMFVNNPAKEFEQTEHSTSAIYLDNNSFSEYSSRLQCDDGAEIIDIRWYGDMHLSRQVFIERKIEYDGNSVIEKISMSQDKVDDFISQRYTAEEYIEELKQCNTDQDYIDTHYRIAQSIQKSIVEKQLEPKLRISLNQLLFESPQNNTLSVTLDSNIGFIKQENVEINHIQDINISHLFQKLISPLYIFPYAVLETRIVVGGKSPLWLSRLLDSKLVYQVPRFSAYLHGVAHFWGPQLPLLPWWIPHMEIDIRTVVHKSGFSGLTRSKSLKPLIDGQYRNRYLQSHLGKKRHPYHHQSITNSIGTKREAINSSTEGSISDFIMDKKENDSVITQQVENVSNSSLLSATSKTLLKNQDKYDDNKFINAYYRGRNNKSQAYLLQDMDTVREIDNIKEAIIKEQKEEKKRKKKEKKQQPPSHTMEPKLFFANERTFIHWLQFAAIILTAALTLLNFGDSITTISGIVFFCISFILAIYAFFRYRYRAYQMSTRPHLRYDDLYGPIGLCILLLGALILNFILRMQHPPATDSYLGINNQTDQQNNSNQPL